MSTSQIFDQKIREPAFKAIVWAAAAVAFPFVPLRLYVRWKVFRRLFIDDAFVVLAYLLLLTFACYWQVRVKSFYVFLEVAAGHALPGPDFRYHYSHYLKVHLFSFILYGFSLWSVKLAFLFFFKRLGHQIRYQYIAWWIVFVWNIVAFIAFMGYANWRCMTATPENAQAKCDNEQSRRFDRSAQKFQASMDVLSDASIIIIPISLLWHVRIQLQTKMALGSIFSLSLFIMMASISRVAVITSGTFDEATYEAWLLLGGAIEMSIAVIVVCVASFRALFSSKTISQRLPLYHREQRQKNTKLSTFARFGFQEISRSSASILDKDCAQDTCATHSNPLKRKSLGFPQMIIDARHNEGEHRQASTTVSATCPEQDALPLVNNQIHVQREFSVYPEAPSAAKTRT